MEVWLAAADGSNVHQLTHDVGLWQCSPQWSPDGREIAFDSEAADGRVIVPAHTRTAEKVAEPR